MSPSRDESTVKRFKHKGHKGDEGGSAEEREALPETFLRAPWCHFGTASPASSLAKVRSCQYSCGLQRFVPVSSSRETTTFARRKAAKFRHLRVILTCYNHHKATGLGMIPGQCRQHGRHGKESRHAIGGKKEPDRHPAPVPKRLVCEFCWWKITGD